MKKIFISLLILSFNLSAIAQDCNLNDEAKRHWFKAEGMREAINNADDWQLVADEYEKAAQDAPDCPTIYYNLGICYEELGKNQPELCDKAIACYQKYLQLNPNADNRSEVEGLIYKIEGKKEVYQKQINENLEKWCGKWYIHYLGTCHTQNSSLPEDFLALEIFISDGNLKARVGAVYSENDWYDGSSSNPPKKTIEIKYQVVPVILGNGYISIEYKSRSIYSRNDRDSSMENSYDENFKLRLVSPYRMEGEVSGGSKVLSSDECFCFEKR